MPGKNSKVFLKSAIGYKKIHLLYLKGLRGIYGIVCEFSKKCKTRFLCANRERKSGFVFVVFPIQTIGIAFKVRLIFPVLPFSENKGCIW